MPTGSEDLAAFVVSGSDGAGGILQNQADTGAVSSSYFSRVTAHFSGSATDFIRLAAVSIDGEMTVSNLGTQVALIALDSSYPVKDNFVDGSALGSIVGSGANGNPGWGLENNPDIPEIDIKVDSSAVTALTKNES